MFGILEEAEAQAQFGGDAFVEFRQPRAVGEVDDGGVEGHVGAADAEPVALVAIGAPGLDRLAHHTQRRVLRPGLTQSAAFQHAPHAIDVDDRGHGGHGDEDAAIGLVAQQAVLGEQAEGLAQRVARDIETVAEGSLRQALAGGKLARDQQRANAPRQSVRKRKAFCLIRHSSLPVPCCSCLSMIARRVDGEL